MRFVLALSVLFLIDLVPRPAGACSLAGNGIHQVDPAHAADTTPPGAVTATGLAIERYQDSSAPCVAGCGDRGYITFEPSASDDATPAELVGYQLRVVRGTPPRGLQDVEDYAITTYGGPAYFYFDYDAPGFDFDLEVRAVDLNGNLGPPLILQIADAPESEGCAAGSGRHPLATWGFAIAALAFVLRRRRAKR